MTSPRYNYGFVRRDLPEVQRIIQWGHALQGATLKDKTVRDVNHTVLFEVADERELLDVARDLAGREVEFYKFFEPDNDYGYTALCTLAVSGARRELFTKFRKYESPDEAAEQRPRVAVGV